MSPSIDACVKLIRSGEMARTIQPYLNGHSEKVVTGEKRSSSSNLSEDNKKQRTA
jgi:hypothetical protein